MHLFLTDEECQPFLRAELQRAFPGTPIEGISPSVLASGDAALSAPETPSPVVFARQALPDARRCHAPSVRVWSETLFTELVPALPEDGPWRLHVVADAETGEGGQKRCRLIEAALHDLLQRKRRSLRRRLQAHTQPLRPEDSFVQLLLTAPEDGWLSILRAPEPFRWRRILSPFPRGEIPVASDRAAPSRAFAKLVEAEQRLGRCIVRGETCVDLGASPGSWSYVALQRGARVLAVDRATLRADLMRHPALTFRRGDAFTFRPDAPVDWLLCDVIAAPARSTALVLEWLRRRWARQFVVTIKFKGHEDYPQLDALKEELASLAEEFFLLRLCANKNEVCAFGASSEAGRKMFGKK